MRYRIETIRVQRVSYSSSFLRVCIISSLRHYYALSRISRWVIIVIDLLQYILQKYNRVYVHYSIFNVLETIIKTRYYSLFSHYQVKCFVFHGITNKLKNVCKIDTNPKPVPGEVIDCHHYHVALHHSFHEVKQ